MANDTASLFQTLVAATSVASEHVKYRNAFLDAIYWDYQPVVATPYQTLNVLIPTVSEGDVADIGAGDLTPTDTDHDPVAIVLDRHYSSSFVIKAWDQVRTPVALAQKYIEPRLEALKRKINRSIAELVTTTNFATYSLISGSGADVFARADIAGAWNNLAGGGVPVEDTRNMTFITNTLAYSNMLASTSFTSEAVVGVTEAEASLQRAVLANQFGARVLYDQHIANYNSGKQAGIYMHRHAIAGVTADPPPSGQGVEEMAMMLGPVPVQVQMQYSLINQGWLINIHCYWGVKVARAAYASLLETA